MNKNVSYLGMLCHDEWDLVERGGKTRKRFSLINKLVQANKETSKKWMNEWEVQSPENLNISSKKNASKWNLEMVFKLVSPSKSIRISLALKALCY